MHGSDRPALAGYVTDIPYMRGFKPMLAPAWLDFVALLGGVRPPAREDGFAWCDLGCGQGVTAAILAATHPAGEFHGIDAMAVHIEHAAGLAAEAEATNAHFLAADFAAALDHKLPRFDYIVAHGVYSWVDAVSRAQLRRFIDRRLQSGGLVYISYNALPGWTGDLPFQYLARAWADKAHGDSAARVRRRRPADRPVGPGRRAVAGVELHGARIARQAVRLPARLPRPRIPARRLAGALRDRNAA